MEKKLAKFEICSKMFDKDWTFWQKKEKWKPKAWKLFWQYFME